MKTQTIERGGCRGYRFEWRKNVASQIEAPELAFADFAEKMKKYFQG